MRLIDADALICKLVTLGWIKQDFLKDSAEMIAVQEIVDNAPTIDPVKHGRWAKDKETGIPYCDWCNENAVFTSGHHYASGDYCSFSGAKMDGEV